MNRRQMVVLWIAALLLSALSVGHGIDYDSLLYTFAVPIVMIGGLLVYQLRDRQSPAANRNDGQSGVNRYTTWLLLAQTALIGHLARSTSADMRDLKFSLESVVTDVQGLESSVQEVAVTVEMLDLTLSSLQE